MKSKIAKLVCTILPLVLLAGCGVNQSEYDSIVIDYAALTSEHETLTSKYDTLASEYKTLNNEYDLLHNEYNELVENTADWRELSEQEKAAQIAKAEADRIIAEEEKAAAERKATEEAAKKAEEKEKKDAEEAAAKAEEEKRGYNTGITFNQLSRNPDDYEGKKVKFTGEVLQVTEVTGEVQIRLATEENSWGGYSGDVIYIFFDSSLISSRILEDDVITIYGIARGLYSYTSVMGANVTLPLIEVLKIDINF
jgi:uncharacterized membrane protein YcgQ (UPF0703/DUF1980 family)